MKFLVFWLLFCGGVMAIALAPFWFDRTVVAVMRHGHIYAYPMAIHTALSLQRHPDQWTLDYRSLRHPTIGTLDWLGGKVEAPFITLTLPDKQTWKPNWIERRIIADAVEDFLRARRNAHLDQLLPRL